MRNAAAFFVAFTAAGAAAAQQQAPTPVPQTVVAPSLPDQPNKEGKVTPGGAMKTDAGGYVDTTMGQIDPNAPKTAAPAPAKTGGTTATTAPGPGIVVPPSPSPAAGAKGKTVVGAASLTVRGVVKSFEKGVSVTVTEANGKDRTVPLAKGANVYEGLAAGDKVVVRIPLQKPADGSSADRVEKQKPPKTAKSKFADQQTK